MKDNITNKFSISKIVKAKVSTKTAKFINKNLIKFFLAKF